LRQRESIRSKAWEPEKREPPRLGGFERGDNGLGIIEGKHMGIAASGKKAFLNFSLERAKGFPTILTLHLPREQRSIVSKV